MKVALQTAVAGDGPDREVVWIVEVQDDRGSEVLSPYGWGGVYDVEERAEDEAVSLARRLDLPISDERGEPFPDPRSFSPPPRGEPL